MKDFTGQRFARLIAVRFTGRVTPSRNAIWELRCDCGGTRFADSGRLTSGKAKSCGCSLRTQFICVVVGCGKRAHSRSLCNRHYKRSKIETNTSFDLRERIAIKTMRHANGCLEWTGTIGQAGYGQTTWQGRKYHAHRLAWERARGPIPAGMLVCHKCDNRKCVDIEHLFLGTQKDNIQDAIAKGRFDPQRMGRLRRRVA